MPTDFNRADTIAFGVALEGVDVADVQVGTFQEVTNGNKLMVTSWTSRRSPTATS